MKKSTILGVLTAAALITTSAVTYAAWDQTKTDVNQQIDVRDRITLTATADIFSGGNLETANDSILYTGTYKFNAKTLGKVNALKLTPTVKNSSGTALEASQYDLEIKKGDTALTATEGVYTDNSVINGENAYTVNLTIKDSNLANTTITVSINGELVQVNPAA